jgi:hypothetical protein
MDPDLPPLPEPEFDPYAAPQAPLRWEAAAARSEDLARDEAIRRAHLSHEASVQSIGGLHYLSVVFCALGFVLTLFRILTPSRQAAPARQGIGLIAVLVYYLAVTALNLAMGIGLTRLKPWARWTEVVLTSLSLVYFIVVGVWLGSTAAAPAGSAGFLAVILAVMMIIPGYILYLLLSPKGAVVFSPEYREIIERTPHIKYKTSWLVKGCLILFILLIVFAVLLAILAPRPQ